MQRPLESQGAASARFSLGRGRGGMLVGALAALLALGALVALATGVGLPARGGGNGGQGGPPEVAQAPVAPDAPNVVLIVADDMRPDSLWAMPELGRLAERGVTFTRSYATTPLCCPSRASIMTGLYSRHHGVLSNTPPSGGVEAFDDRSTLATWLKAAGVRTGLVGRYLNGYATTDVPLGWDSWFALWQVSEEYGNYNDYRVTDNGERRYFGNGANAYSTRVLGQQALRFIQEDSTRPFMLMLTPRAPHNPATPDPIDSGTFKDLEMALSPSYNEKDVSDKPAWVRNIAPMGEKKLERLEAFRRRQFDTLLGLDRAIGTLVEALRADGRLDRTWIIFTADNGLTIGEHRLDIGKGCAYEECVRVPLVVVPPLGMGTARADDHLVANIDLAPTIAEIMGVRAPAADGRSLVPLLADPSTPWRDALILEQERDDDGRSFVALRTSERKYVRYGDESEELYDHVGDPHELNNQANAQTWAAEKRRLIERLEVLLATPPGG